MKGNELIFGNEKALCCFLMIEGTFLLVKNVKLIQKDDVISFTEGTHVMGSNTPQLRQTK